MNDRAPVAHDPRRAIVDWLNNDQITAQVQRALPKHIPLDFFVRCAQTSLLNNPNLAGADKGSLLRELVAVAQLGLLLDPQLAEAWLIIDRNGKVQRRVGYQGLRKLVLQSKLVGAPSSQAVFEKDVVEIELGDDAHVHHRVDPKTQDRGAPLGCWARAKILETGENVVEWMSWSDIEAHRDRYSDAYKGRSGPWTDPLGQIEMGRKTVLRRLCKHLPKSPQLAEQLAYEDRADMRDITPSGAMALPAPDEPEDDLDRIAATNAAQRSEDAPRRAAAAPQQATPPEDAPEATPAAASPGEAQGRDESLSDVLGEALDKHAEPQGEGRRRQSKPPVTVLGQAHVQHGRALTAIEEALDPDKGLSEEKLLAEAPAFLEALDFIDGLANAAQKPQVERVRKMLDDALASIGEVEEDPASAESKVAQEEWPLRKANPETDPSTNPAVLNTGLMPDGTLMVLGITCTNSGEVYTAVADMLTAIDNLSELAEFDYRLGAVLDKCSTVHQRSIKGMIAQRHADLS